MNQLTTACSVRNQIPSVYDRINDPLAFVETMGRVFWQAKACGCQTEAEGKLLALACLSERMNPFDINRQYHLMEGKLSMKADVMLAKLREIGGKYKWVKDGEDGKSASLELTYDGNTITSTYTIDQAKQAGLVKDKSNWVKDPASMLRARVTSRGIRMIAPEVIAGVYTPEEISDFSDDGKSVEPVKAKSTRKPPAKDASQDEPIDASYTVTTEKAEPEKQSPEKEQPPFSGDDKKESSANETTKPEAKGQSKENSDTTMLVLEIERVAGGVGMTLQQLESRLKSANPEFKSIDDLPEDKLKTLLANLEKQVEAAKAKSASGN